MALSDLQKIRLKIADRPRVVIDEEIGTGDGVKLAFGLLGAPVQAGSETITVNGATQSDPADYSLDDDTGVVTFVAAPAPEALIAAGYTWSVFSDEELQDALDDQATINGAAAEAIRWILADTDRFIKYTLGQEAVDRSSTRDSLKDMLDRLEKATGPIGLVLADTDLREDSMAPFIEQPEEYLDVFTDS